VEEMTGLGWSAAVAVEGLVEAGIDGEECPG